GRRGRRQRQSAATTFTAVQPLAAAACVNDSKAWLGSRGPCEEIDWMSGLKGREFGADSSKTSVFICCTQSCLQGLQERGICHALHATQYPMAADGQHGRGPVDQHTDRHSGVFLGSQSAG